jgi:hypothetical protein
MNPIPLDELLPNFDDISPEEVFAAAASIEGSYLQVLDNGTVVCDPLFPENGAYIVSRRLMDKVLEAVNIIGGIRRLKARALEKSLDGDGPSLHEQVQMLQADIAALQACYDIQSKTCEIALENGDRMVTIIEQLTVENDELRRKLPRRRFGW